MMAENSQNNEPKVAIVIPVYNRKPDLIRLLKSVFELEYGNFDVFVIDNGSADGLEEINELYPDVAILKNEHNYGATAGFNKGLLYAASNGEYKYIWMLDSDLIVDMDSLCVLVNVMEEDNGIGIAGPKILNIHNKNLIVEVGANIDLNTAQVFPLYCNEPDFDTKELFEVDYVGSGISLLRIEAFKKTGTMDERYFFLWDDMDYGLWMKRNGYRVVAVPNARVYHPPFTEKRSVGVNAYYGVRSMLLTVSKYRSKLSRVISIYNVLRRVLKISSFRLLSGYPGIAKLNIYALWDFCMNRWGESDRIGNYTQKDNINSTSDLAGDTIKKALVLESGSFELASEIIDSLKSLNENTEIFMLVQNYRKRMFETLPIDEFILYDDRRGNVMLRHLQIFFRLLFSGFDVAVNPDPQTGSPFTYAIRKVYEWDSPTRSFYKSSLNVFEIWKIPLSVLFGEILALILLPLVYFASLKYEIK